jgi:hypothetical protein
MRPRSFGRVLVVAAIVLSGSPLVIAPARSSEAHDRPPVEAGALLAWLRADGYRQWPKESAPHRSMGAHRTLVITYLNPALDGSLRAGSKSHPVGSASVKELLDEQGRRAGWAVSMKTAADSQEGKGWDWFELSDSNAGSAAASSRGLPACVGCHRGGKDFVLTPHPLD